MSGADHQPFMGSWSVDGFETVLAGDMTYASKKDEGHGGSFGKWSYASGDGANGTESCVILDMATVFPTNVYGINYTGAGPTGATKIEYAKKFAMKIVSVAPDRITATHAYSTEPMIMTRREAMIEPLLSVRVEEIKALLAIAEAKVASDQATWNRQFGIAEDLQDFRWKQINSWKLS